MDDANFDGLPWEEIKEIGEKGLFEQVFKKIPKARFQFAAKEENQEYLVQAALKSLRMKNPDASHDQAIVLAGFMYAFAKKIVKT